MNVGGVRDVQGCRLSKATNCQVGGKRLFDFRRYHGLVGHLLFTVSEVDQLSEALEIRGIIIYETAPSGKDTDLFEDYSRVDYDAIFDEIISLSPELEYIVEIIRQLPPPQYGEISTLTAQVAAGNTFARERLILIHLRVAIRIALSMAKSHQYDIADAVSAGFVGLIIAVDRFDPDGFSAFQSYASLWIQQNINREAILSGWSIIFLLTIKKKCFRLTNGTLTTGVVIAYPIAL